MPKSKAGQLADLLRVRLRSGEWKACLPPERALADEYLVSRTTVRQALAFLQNEGLIGDCGSTRQGRSVRVRTPGSRPGPLAGRVVFLTPSMSDSPLILEQLAVLRELLGGAGVQVAVRDHARLTSLKDPAPSLARLFAEYPGAVWILHKMSRKVQEAVAAAGVPAVVFGSSFAGVAMPSIDVDFGAVARHAAVRCLRHGHRRLSVIVHRTPLAGDERMVEALAAELARCGGQPPRVMKHDFNRARLADALDREIVSGTDRPDVLLVVNQHHLLTALPHLLWRGLRIPADLSLIYLNNDPAAERLSPLPERYHLGDRLLRRLAAAIQACLAGEVPPSAMLLPVEARGETFK
jgi:DNA-binding LacI/PurR family transcriptional regulator